MLIVTILAAAAVLGMISMPGVPRKREYTIVKPRVQWQELGYRDYCNKYIY